MDQAAIETIESKYKKLWTQYKISVLGLYFSDKPITGTGSLFDWQGDFGVQGSQQDPLITYLQTPRLSPELEQHLKE